MFSEESKRGADQKFQARPRLVLVPARPAGQKDEPDYSGPENQWFEQVRRLADIWKQMDFE